MLCKIDHLTWIRSGIADKYWSTCLTGSDHSMDDYEILNRIGDGTFGTVYLCRKRKPAQTGSPSPSTNGAQDDQELVAIKKMKRRYYNWSDCMQLREVKALKRLNHKNIVLLKEVVRENNHLYLVFEHMDENLYQLMRRQPDPFNEPTIRDIILQILNGLAYIHKHNLFHRDIKPENLLCRNNGQSIKIADFGLTREIDGRPPYTDYVSTRWYRAPELLLHSNDYSWSVDIWALGCITGELYTLKPMFPGRSEIDQIFKICQVLGAPDTALWPEGERLASIVHLNFPNLIPLHLDQLLSNCSSHGLEFIRYMLQWAPTSRPRAKDLLKNCYLTQ